MKNFFIITNHEKDPSLSLTDQVRVYLEERGARCSVYDSAGESVPDPWRYTDPHQVPEDTECVIVLGGDGTLLQAARDLVDTSFPLLGVNLGSLGYLAEVEFGHMHHAMDSLLTDQYYIENRMMINGVVMRGGEKILDDMALNDIVVTRRGKLRVVDLSVLVNNTFLSSYRADGIIISTPTGSTGYSLSAGGPIVSPDASLMLVTAIAPHTLNSRTVVLPDMVVVKVVLGSSRGSIEGGAEVTFDGDTVLPLNTGDQVVISRSQRITRLVKINHTSFVEILRKKMN